MYHRYISKVWQTIKSQHNSRCITNIISYYNIHHRNYIDRSTIMQCTSYGLQQWSYIERLDQFCHHKPIVQGVDYSPLIVESKVETLVKEKRRPVDSGRGSPLQSLQVQPLFCGFRVSSPPPAITPREGGGGLYIVFFRSIPSIWDQDGQHRMLEGQTRHGGAARGGARTTSARLGFVGPLQCFFFSWFASGKILMPEKS
jgi:hypothetical protein